MTSHKQGKIGVFLSNATKSGFLINLFLGAFLGIVLLRLGAMQFKYIGGVGAAFLFFLAFSVCRDKRKFLLAVVTLLLPFAATNIYVGGIPRVENWHAGGAQIFPQINAVDFVFLPALMLLVIKGVSNRSYQWNILSFPALAAFGLLIWAGISLFFTQHLRLGIVSLFDLTKVTLLFIYFAGAVQSERDTKLVARLLILGLAVQGAYGLYQWFYGLPKWAIPFTEIDLRLRQTIGESQLLRVTGTIGYSNVFAQYIVLLLPLAISKQVTASKNYQILFYSAAAVLATASLVGTLSRAGWVACILGLVTVICFVLMFGSSRWKKRTIVASACLLGAFVILSPVIMDRLTTDDEGAALSRIPMNKVALNIIKKNPVFGTGLNSYSEIMYSYDPKNLIKFTVWPVHNVYLFICAEIGIPGLSLLLAFLGSVIWSLLIVMKRLSEDIRVIAIGLIAGILSVMAQSLVVTGFKQSIQLWYILWAVCGLATAVARLGSSQSCSMISNR